MKVFEPRNILMETLFLCVVIMALLIFTVVPCILILSSLLFIQLNAQLECSRKMLKLTLKFTLKRSYMFRLQKPLSGSLLLCFAKVIIIKIQ